MKGKTTKKESTEKERRAPAQPGDKRLGNEFWRLRSKHGRDRLFSEPEKLWEAACEYFQWCENNPIIAIDYKGKDAIKVEIPKLRPFTLHGLCLYLNVNTAYFRQFKQGLRVNESEVDKDFSTVITRIEETIYDQKFTGAAAGFLNPNIIARDLGLKDVSDVSLSDNRKAVADLFPEDLG